MATENKSLSDLAQLKGDAGTTDAPGETAPVHVQKLDAFGRAYATGKRKNAIARVWLKRGAGRIIVNDKEFSAYFARPVLRMIVQQPLVVAKRVGQYDLVVTVAGGGLSGQAGAVRHGLAKALTHYEPELQALTGLDPAVASWLSQQSDVHRMIHQIEGFLTQWLPALNDNNRSYVTVAIGCTGGQHRSVFIAKTLNDTFQTQWPTLLRHREINL